MESKTNGTFYLSSTPNMRAVYLTEIGIDSFEDAARRAIQCLKEELLEVGVIVADEQIAGVWSEERNLAKATVHFFGSAELSVRCGYECDAINLGLNFFRLANYDHIQTVGEAVIQVPMPPKRELFDFVPVQEYLML